MINSVITFFYQDSSVFHLLNPRESVQWKVFIDTLKTWLYKLYIKGMVTGHSWQRIQETDSYLQNEVNLLPVVHPLTMTRGLRKICKFGILYRLLSNVNYFPPYYPRPWVLPYSKTLFDPNQVPLNLILGNMEKLAKLFNKYSETM